MSKGNAHVVCSLVEVKLATAQRAEKALNTSSDEQKALNK